MAVYRNRVFQCIVSPSRGKKQKTERRRKRTEEKQMEMEMEMEMDKKTITRRKSRRRRGGRRHGEHLGVITLRRVKAMFVKGISGIYE
jgi:hypothetical protein